MKVKLETSYVLPWITFTVATRMALKFTLDFDSFGQTAKRPFDWRPYFVAKDAFEIDHTSVQRPYQYLDIWALVYLVYFGYFRWP